MEDFAAVVVPVLLHRDPQVFFIEKLQTRLKHHLVEGFAHREDQVDEPLRALIWYLLVRELLHCNLAD